MSKTKLKQIADNEGLDYIETTSETFGTPLNVKGAIIGFDTMENVEQLKTKYPSENWNVIAMHKKNDTDYWSRDGKVFREFENGADDFNDADYKQIQKMGEEEFIYTQIMQSVFFPNFELIFTDKSITEMIQIVEELKIAFYQDKTGYIEQHKAIEVFTGSKTILTFDELTGYLQNKMDIYNEVFKMDEDQLVITYKDKYFDTIDKFSMHFENDIADYVIGVEFE